ncbi:MAG: PhzF family phenazine biosynthesis protein [Oceanicaulis sp.]
MSYAAFARGERGGNPAGVAIVDFLPTDAEMQETARRVGYSETVFAAPVSGRDSDWRVRYFAPEGEVAFCGHATLALAHALHKHTGRNRHRLALNNDTIECAAENGECEILAPPYTGRLASNGEIDQIRRFFTLADGETGPAPLSVVSAGAQHLAVEVRSREILAAMKYDFNAVQRLTRAAGWATVALFFRETAHRIHIRNAFAFGGVVEDPATGAAAAALSGFLQDQNPEAYSDSWVEFLQGDDMGQPCTIHVHVPAQPGGPPRVRGAVRAM